MARSGVGRTAGIAARCLIGGVLTACLPNLATAACQLNSVGNKIQHIVHIQFDNVHFRRDDPNVPSDLEQMPNLLSFLENNGTLLTRHHTPLISHTSVDIVTTLTGVYGDKFGVPIGNTLRYFNPDGSSTGAVSFAYWTDPLDSFSGSPTDTTPEMIDQQGKTHPAPWVPFTRAGCDVGAFSTANIELENVGLDVNTVFGNPSPEATEVAANPPDANGNSIAIADFEGIAIHCAQGSLRCATGKLDKLPQEPGGYVGFNGLFGNKYVAPVIFGGPAVDLDGNQIKDSSGNLGFPGFDPTASQTLGYLAKMLEAGVPVVYGYIEDAHDNHVTDSAFGPGEVGYVAQLAAFNDAFGKFFARLQKDGITKENTLFIITSDENDHFAGGPPTPLGCDGIHVPCTYAKIGEVQADLRKVLFTETGDATPFTVHSDDAPTVYVTGNPTQTDPITRKLEREMGGLMAVNPITGNPEMLTQALADHAEQGLLHMISADPNRTPTFILFANPDYFLFASSASLCALPLCFTENPAFAWNHGDFQEEITKTWLGLVGPGIMPMGQTDTLFSDHTDIRPTMLTLVGLKDVYSHDGRALFEVIDGTALPGSLTKNASTLHALADALKQINAPRGVLGATTLTGISTQALKGNDAGDATYTQLEAEIELLTAQRNVLADQMLSMLENAEFNGVPIDNNAAEHLIKQAQALVESVE